MDNNVDTAHFLLLIAVIYFCGISSGISKHMSW